MKKKSLLALVLTGVLVILGSTFIEAAKPLMVQDMENMQILTPSAPEGGGWAVSPWGIGCWEMGGDLFAQVIESPPGDPVYYDGWTSDEPLPLVINIDIDPDLSPAELVNVPAGYCVELTFDGGQKKKVYLPHITGDDLIDGWISPDLYVAKDGSTYWDEALTQLAQSAKGIGITITPDKKIYSPGECATFDIQMKRRNKPANIKPGQIIATFPDKDTQVTLTRVGRGKYTYTTPELTKSGSYTLEVTLYKRGALRSISRLERTKGRIERIITHLEEVKEELKNPKAVKRLERTIKKLRKIITKIGRTIERHRTRGVIGKASSTITVKRFKVKISSPIDGDTIDRWETIVSGVIEPFPTEEIGISVNGNIAMINGDRFAAIVPLEKGTNTIEAKAVDWSGYITTDSITVNNDNPVVSEVSIDPSPAIGIIPLEVTFSVTTNIPHPIALYEMDYDDNGVVDYSSEELTELSYEYYTEYLYYPKLTVTDEEGNQYSGITLVNVMPMPDLVSKWNSAKTALSEGNIDEALKYYALSEEEKENARNNAPIIRAHLSEIMQDLGDIRFIEFKGNIAIYEMTPAGGGTPDSIIFIQDVDGLWKIMGE